MMGLRFSRRNIDHAFLRKTGTYNAAGKIAETCLIIKCLVPNYKNNNAQATPIIPMTANIPTIFLGILPSLLIAFPNIPKING